MKNVFLLLMGIILAAGCTDDAEVYYTDTPIVESYLMPGGYFSVKVSRQIPFSENAVNSSDDIDNLNITVEVDGVTHLLEALGNGIYIDSSLIVTEGGKYDLTFTFNSKNVSAYTYIPLKPDSFIQSATVISIERMDTASGPPTQMTMPDPVTLSWTNTDNSYYIIVVNNIEETLDPIRDFGDEDPPGNMFRKKPTNTTTTEIRSMDFQYYGTHQLILYHVLPDYASLYDENNTTSLNLTNPSTAVVNGYGIFTGLNADTLYIEVKEL